LTLSCHSGPEVSRIAQLSLERVPRHPGGDLVRQPFDPVEVAPQDAVDPQQLLEQRLPLIGLGLRVHALDHPQA
jgi:hypothetical protein